MQTDRVKATDQLRLRQASSAAWAARQAAASAALEASELARQARLGSYVLTEMQPPLVSEEQVEGVRGEITEKRAAEAEAEHVKLKAEAGERAKAEAEAKIAEQAAALEEAKAAALEAAKAEQGEDAVLPEGWAPEGDAPEPVDVEAFVAAAVEAVALPEPKEVTIDDILCVMLDRAMVTREAIMQAMAVDAMGEAAWFRVQEAEAARNPPPEPEPVPVVAAKKR